MLKSHLLNLFPNVGLGVLALGFLIKTQASIKVMALSGVYSPSKLFLLQGLAAGGNLRKFKAKVFSNFWRRSG